MEYSTLLVEKTEGIATVTINRPEALNALNLDVLRELKALVHDELKGAEDVRVVILTGAGEKAFIAGADIKAMEQMDRFDIMTFAELGHTVLDSLEALEVPVIAAVNGFALGGGCEIAMACDMIIASENARFGQPEINLGIIPGFGGTQRLPRYIGRGRAKELIYTGDMISAERAYEMGLAVRLCPAGQALEDARKLAAKLASKPAFALRQAKKAINRGCDLDMASAKILKKEVFALCFGTEDQKEGMKAFMEKRKPEFTGR